MKFNNIFDRILIYGLFILICSPIGGISLYWLDWLTGDRDYWLPIVPYCGGLIGGIAGIYLGQLFLKKMWNLEKKQEDSNENR